MKARKLKKRLNTLSYFGFNLFDKFRYGSSLRFLKQLEDSHGKYYVFVDSHGHIRSGNNFQIRSIEDMKYIIEIMGYKKI